MRYPKNFPSDTYTAISAESRWWLCFEAGGFSPVTSY
jgi:hypothetical protein